MNILSGFIDIIGELINYVSLILSQFKYMKPAIGLYMANIQNTSISEDKTRTFLFVRTSITQLQKSSMFQRVCVKILKLE